MGEKRKDLNEYKAVLNKQQGFESLVKIRDHSITIDEPEKAGGTDKGPNPVEVLLSSVVGCLDFTGTIVAKEMGYKLEEFELTVEGGLDPRGVMGKADVPVGLQYIRVEVINIKGIPEEKIPEFLKEVEARCPVRNTLKDEVFADIER